MRSKRGTARGKSSNKEEQKRYNKEQEGSDEEQKWCKEEQVLCPYHTRVRTGDSGMCWTHTDSGGDCTTRCVRVLCSVV